MYLFFSEVNFNWCNPLFACFWTRILSTLKLHRQFDSVVWSVADVWNMFTLCKILLLSKCQMDLDAAIVLEQGFADVCYKCVCTHMSVPKLQFLDFLQCLMCKCSSHHRAGGQVWGAWCRGRPQKPQKSRKVWLFRPFLVFATSVVQLCKYPSSRRSDGRVGGDRWRGHSGLTILSPVILSFFPHSGRGRDRPRASSTGLREHLVPVSYFSEHHMWGPSLLKVFHLNRLR